MNVKKLFANLALVLFSLSITFLLGEYALRFIRPEKNTERSLLFSSRTFRMDDEQAIRYFPNETIRSVTIYNKKIEYDVKFHTNNLGLVDDQDYMYENIPGKKYYAFVGDSFTAGYHGGDPWVPSLRKKLQSLNIEIYNLGVDGACFKHFYMLLKSMKKKIEFTDIVILAISNDFKRRFWYPLTDEEKIRFCDENESTLQCRQRFSVGAKIFPYHVSDEEIIKISEANGDTRDNLGIRKFHLFRLLIESIDNYFWRYRNVPTLAYSFNYLAKIKETFPQAHIYFIHLPEKQEVLNNRYFTEYIEKKVKEMGITYFPVLKNCKWSKDMFYPHDGHPNQVGYNNISQCVSGFLFGR